MTRKVTQQQDRRRARPVDIVDHEHQRDLLGDGCQPGSHRLEQPVPSRLRIGDPWLREAGRPVGDAGQDAADLGAETGVDARARRPRSACSSNGASASMNGWYGTS